MGRSTFRRVCASVLSRFSANTTLEATILAKILDAAGPDISAVSLHGGRMFWRRPLQAIWEVCTVPSSWSTPRLISGCWSVASNESLHLCLGAWTRSDWRNSWETAWRAKRLGTGCSLVPHCEKPLLRAAFPCQASSMWWRIFLGVWPLVVSYLKETGWKDDGESIVIMSSNVGVCLHHINVLVTSLLFRIRGVCTTIRLLEWILGCMSSSRNL